MRQSPRSRMLAGVLPVALALLLAGPLAGQPGSSKKEPRYKGKTISYWVQELQSEQDARRLEAKHALRAFGTKAEAAVPALKLMLEDLSPEFRQFALVTLHEIGPLAKLAVPELVNLIKEENNHELRKLAADTLGRIGPDAAAALPALRDVVAALEHPKNRAGFLEREHFLVVMTQIGTEAALPLADLLDKEDAELRQHVLLAFEALGPKAEKAVPRLEPLLKDSNAWVRFITARALWKINRHKESVTTFAKLLDDQDLTLRTEVAWTLGKMGSDAHEALPSLQKQLEEADKNNADPRFDRFRATALNAIFRIDPETRTQEPPLNDTAEKIKPPEKPKEAEKPKDDLKPGEEKSEPKPGTVPEPPPPPPAGENKPAEVKPGAKPTTLPAPAPEQSRRNQLQRWISFFH